MNIICMRVRRSLTVDRTSDLMTKLLGKEQIGVQLHLSNHG